MYSGTWVDNETIIGWYMCNGDNGTVNLVDKFVRGGITSGASGGSDDSVIVQHNHSGWALLNGNHGHNIKTLGLAGNVQRLEAAVSKGNVSYSADIVVVGGSHIHSLDINEEGISGVDKNIPAYYTLIFIQRIN